MANLLGGLSSFQKDIIDFVAYLILCVVVFFIAITFFSPH